MSYAFGSDISQFQYDPGLVNFDKMKADPRDPQFIGIRTGTSWGSKDAWFHRSWPEAKRVGLGRIGYHVIYFGEDATRQIDNLFRITEGSDWDTDRLALDLELHADWSKQVITRTTLLCMQRCAARTGRYPILYSRASWINAHLKVGDLPDADWWLAQYLNPRPYPEYTPEYPAGPALPTGVTKWLIHQTCSRADARLLGATSLFIDLNRWNGNNQAVATYFNKRPATDLSMSEKVDLLWSVHPELHR